MPVITSSGSQTIDAVLWVGWADQDYIAARPLLLRGLVVQGAALANTATEKYLKGVCTLASIPCDGVDHDVSRLNGILHHQRITLGLNAKFLRFLNKSYRLRYPDDLVVGFNIALNSTATLVEMDLTVQKIRSGFAFQKDGKSVGTKLDGMKASHSAELLTNNCVIGGTNKNELFAQSSSAYDLRVLENRVIIEASYAVERLLDDENFEREGLGPVAGSEDKSFKLAWLPYQPKT